MCIYILGAAAAAAVSSRRRIRGEIHTLSYLGTPEVFLGYVCIRYLDRYTVVVV